MIATRACVEVRCDDCDAGWFEQGAWDGGIPHWATEAAAREDLADMGWDLYDDGQAICPVCTAERICAQVGHTFLPPAECRCEGRIPAHRDGCTPWHDCAMCGFHESIDA